MSWIFRSERKNYSCILEIVNVAVCEGLREIFKQEWDKHYGATKGVWDDTPKCGNELYNMEKSRPLAKKYLKSYQSGKRSEWDSSAISDAILYSNALGKTRLAPHVFKEVNELRKLRNDVTHVHGPQHKISSIEFDKAYNQIQNCFKVLKLSTRSVKIIRDSWKRKIVINFGKMMYICLAIFIAGLLSSALYYWYKNFTTAKAFTSFRILPVRPQHLVANRSRTVDAILEELYNLRARNNRSLTYFYISGNPGSGKSQLAMLVGQQYGVNNFMKDSFSNDIVFVMTLQARSVQNILHSYVDLARRVYCDDNIITNIMNSSHTSRELKIQSLKTEIAKILKNVEKEYTWLLIVDNVVKLKEVSSFLPHLAGEDWQGGQVLVTTQDMSSVPPNSSLTVHISVSEGMYPVESVEFLTNLSGVVESWDLVEKVAKELDYQPLALASAAFYIKQLRETKASPYFNWTDYLNKLDEGKRNLTEEKLSEVNKLAYSLTMSTAVLLAVRSFAESDPVLKHAFTFFSFISHEAQALDVVVSYVLRVDKQKDKDDVQFTIVQCSLILVSRDEKGVLVSMHHVVLDNVKNYISSLNKGNKRSREPSYVLQSLLQQKCALTQGEIAQIPHLKAFYLRTKNLSLPNIVPGSMKSKKRMQKQIVDLTAAIYRHGEISLSKNFLIFALKIAEKNIGVSKESKHVLFPKIGEIYYNLGVIESKLENTEQAREYLEMALKILTRQNGPSHKSVSKCLLSLASLCSNPKDCNVVESEKYSKKALSIDDSLENKAKHYNVLYLMHYYEGDFEQAAKDCSQVIEILQNRAALQGADCVTMHLDLALMNSNMGALWHRTGNYEVAKKFYYLSIYIYEKVTGPHHLDLANSYYNLGLAHCKLKELTNAEACFRRALAIYTQHLESSHKTIARVSLNLAEVLEEKNQLDDAAVLYKQYGCYCKLKNLGIQWD